MRQEAAQRQADDAITLGLAQYHTDNAISAESGARASGDLATLITANS